MSFELSRRKREDEILRVRENSTPVSTGISLPIRTGETFNVYNIPVELLIYNHLNDRFASKRKEYKYSTGNNLTNTDEESLKIIENFIWSSNIARNQETLKDIEKKGQKKYGVITTDGRIIDGNRRATLIRKIFYSKNNEFPTVEKEDFRFFKAVILPGDISDDEMIKLETQIQMGEDEKVEYNAIEKYIKIDKLYNNNIPYSDIASMISSIKTDKEATKMHNTYKLMEEYLDYIDAKDRFSLINKFEDHFLRINSIMSSYKKGKYMTDWAPSDLDMLELKHVSFDFIRKGHEGKDFRNIAGGQKDEKGIFAKKEVWDKFLEKHNSIIDNAEKKMKHNNENIPLSQREQLWVNEVKKGVDYSFKRAKEAVNNHLAIDRPRFLIEGALDKLRLIDVESFIKNYNEQRDKETYDMIKEINVLTALMKENIVNSVFKKKK